MFIDQSKDETDKDANKENAEKDVNKDNEEVKKKESTISLEVADAEDNSADSDDDMDVNAGLDKCFDALEKKIANEDNSDSNSVKEVESRPVEDVPDLGGTLVAPPKTAFFEHLKAEMA